VGKITIRTMKKGKTARRQTDGGFVWFVLDHEGALFAVTAAKTKREAIELAKDFDLWERGARAERVPVPCQVK
jgi:hypothetical protein